MRTEREAFIWIAFAFLSVIHGAQGFTTPLVVGHRGDSAHAPENTMIAFQQALVNGDGFETDFRLTKDMQVVLIHDDTVDRTTNGTGYVSNFTLEEIQSLDAGSWFDPIFAGAQVPSFRQALTLINNTKYFIVMDLKVEGLGYYIAEVLKDFPGVQYQLVASCWTDTEVADSITYLNDTAQIQKLTSTLPPNPDSSYFIGQLNLGVRAFSINYAILNDSFVKQAHSYLMPVYAWTMTNQLTVNQMVDMGVDGLIANDVEATQDYIMMKNQPLDADSGDDDTNIPLVVGVSTSLFVFGVLVGVIFMFLLFRRKHRRPRMGYREILPPSATDS